MFLKNKSGFTFTDTLVSAALVGIITIIASVGISAFINKFNELRSFSILQEQAMQLIETVRYGELVKDPDDSAKMAYMGINGAFNLQLDHDLAGIGIYGGVTIELPSQDSQENSENQSTGQYVKYYHNAANGKIMCNVSAASRVPGKTYPYSIFPRSNKFDIEVESFEISRKNPNDANDQMRTADDSNTYFYRINLLAHIYTNRVTNSKKTVEFTTYVGRPIDASNL